MKHHAPQPEFSRPLQVDRVPKAGSTEKIAAEPAELKALARRLKVPALHALSAELRATPWRGGGLKLEGHITADIEQVSVISVETFRETGFGTILGRGMFEAFPGHIEDDGVEKAPSPFAVLAAKKQS